MITYMRPRWSRQWRAWQKDQIKKRKDLLAAMKDDSKNPTPLHSDVVPARSSALDSRDDQRGVSVIEESHALDHLSKSDDTSIANLMVAEDNELISMQEFHDEGNAESQDPIAVAFDKSILTIISGNESNSSNMMSIDNLEFDPSVAIAR
jgi:hypothetical protein